MFVCLNGLDLPKEFTLPLKLLKGFEILENQLFIFLLFNLPLPISLLLYIVFKLSVATKLPVGNTTKSLSLHASLIDCESLVEPFPFDPYSEDLYIYYANIWEDIP